MEGLLNTGKKAFRFRFIGTKGHDAEKRHSLVFSGTHGHPNLIHSNLVYYINITSILRHKYVKLFMAMEMFDIHYLGNHNLETVP